MKTLSNLFCRLAGGCMLVLLTGVLHAQAPFRTSYVFADHMVLQRGRPDPVWGYGIPGKQVWAEIDGQTVSTHVQADGRWKLLLPILEPGKPRTLVVRCGETRYTFTDVLVGEVWLASGQSNMEYQVGFGLGPGTDSVVASADRPDIRFLQVPFATSIQPREDLDTSHWVVCSPQTVRSCSAVAYFFAKDLQDSLHVPIGILAASKGASSAESWTSMPALNALPDYYERIQHLDTSTRHWDQKVAQAVWQDHSRDSLAAHASQGLSLGVPRLRFSDTSWPQTVYPLNLGTMHLGGFWGLVWLRKVFNLPKGFMRQGDTVLVPVYAREARIYLNGQLLATWTNATGSLKRLMLPKALLRPGTNVLAIRLYVIWGNGGLGFPGQDMALVNAAGQHLDLGGSWRYNGHIEPPLPGWQQYYNTPGVLFNAMIHPLIPYGIQGAIWYQGENNASRAYGYRSLLPALFTDWRVRWQEGYTPFLIVQLPNYMRREAKPSESQWAELREAQALAARYPNTGLAVTIDLGEARNIHPKDKWDVGYRLCLQALKRVYGHAVVADGPRFDSMQVEGSAVRVVFRTGGSSLVQHGSGPLEGFEVAGSDHRFYWAQAELEGSSVMVHAPEVPHPVAVRYAWANNPAVNLYNAAGLPAAPFRTDSWIWPNP